MRKRYAVSLSFDEKTLNKLDSIRGLIPRSRFIEKVILDSMGNEND